MIDPFTAITAATTAFNTIKRMVEVGREAEDVFGQMGKWYSAVTDLNKAEEQCKHPPLFKKLFNSGSIEEEALAVLVHKKKIKEQEDQLRVLLEYRFGYGTWDEMIQLRRKIKAQREETVYRQEERLAFFLDLIVVAIITAVSATILGGVGYLVAMSRGWL